MVIDEIQRCPGLILAIKASIDRDRRPGRFILTASSDLLRLERTPDSLAGRAVTAELGGLSQGEAAGRLEDFIARVLAPGDPRSFTTRQKRADYVARVSRGGYPEVQGLDLSLRRVWMDSYLTRIVQRDSRDVTVLTQPERLRSLLRLLAANQAGELVNARIARGAQVPASSVAAYLDVLETLFLITKIPPWTPNLTKREVGRPKAIVADSGLAVRLSRLAEDQLLSLAGSNHLGGLLEGFVASELIKQHGWSSHEYELFHYRDRNGPEVDLVIELGDGSVVGLEVKASQTYRTDHFTGLAHLRDRLGDRFRAGFVLGTASGGYQYADRLWGLPVSAIWEW